MATADGLVHEAAALADRLRGTEHEAAAERLLAQAESVRQSVLGILAVVGVTASSVGLDVDLRCSAVGPRADELTQRPLAA